jgi:hypothetical protein
MSDRSGHILESGPSHNPTAPKSAGWHTHVVDHASREELRQKYTGHSVNLDAIEEVDTIWREGSLADAVPAVLHGTFTTLIASHVIEHVPDLAGFLVAAQRLLSEDGVVAVALPDRRFSFDYFKPATLTGDVLEAHAASRACHSRRSVWNEVAYSVTVDGAIAWGQEPINEPVFVQPFANARAADAAFSDAMNAPYVDCHAWQFTPASFALVILELGQLGVIDWRVDQLHGPEGCEFYAFLRRGIDSFADATALQARRMELLRQQMQEMKQQIDFGLARSTQPGGGEAPRPIHEEANLERGGTNVDMGAGGFKREGVAGSALSRLKALILFATSKATAGR